MLLIARLSFTVDRVQRYSRMFNAGDGFAVRGSHRMT